jgi:hypothetical protein
MEPLVYFRHPALEDHRYASRAADHLRGGDERHSSIVCKSQNCLQINRKELNTVKYT